MRTVAGCSGEAVVAGATLSSSGSCPPTTMPAAELATVGYSSHHCSGLGCSSSFGATESPSCGVPSFFYECLSTTCSGTL